MSGCYSSKIYQHFHVLISPGDITVLLCFLNTVSIQFFDTILIQFTFPTLEEEYIDNHIKAIFETYGN